MFQKQRELQIQLINPVAERVCKEDYRQEIERSEETSLCSDFIGSAFTVKNEMVEVLTGTIQELPVIQEDILEEREQLSTLKLRLNDVMCFGEMFPVNSKRLLDGIDLHVKERELVDGAIV